MTRAWLDTLANAKADGIRADVAVAIPVIQTERLTLRGPRIEDWAELEPIWTTDGKRVTFSCTISARLRIVASSRFMLTRWNCVSMNPGAMALTRML